MEIVHYHLSILDEFLEEQQKAFIPTTSGSISTGNYVHLKLSIKNVGQFSYLGNYQNELVAVKPIIGNHGG